MRVLFSSLILVPPPPPPPARNKVKATATKPAAKSTNAPHTTAPANLWPTHFFFTRGCRCLHSRHSKDASYSRRRIRFPPLPPSRRAAKARAVTLAGLCVVSNTQHVETPHSHPPSRAFSKRRKRREREQKLGHAASKKKGCDPLCAARAHTQTHTHTFFDAFVSCL